MRAAFFDIDGTLTSERTWKGIMDYFQQRGLRRSTHLAFLGVHYPLYFMRRMKLISESAFRGPWAAHLVWYVRGYTPRQADEVWDWSITQFLSRYWRADTRTLLDEHLRAGDLVVLVSAAPQPLVERVACEVGAQHAVGTRFALRDGRYTGRALPPVVIDANKAIAAQSYLASHNLNIDLPGSFAYADSITDLPLLEMVGHPVAVYADDGLHSIAIQRGWRVFPA
jgi:HAD superfamily hydrolase (TIGR01490 family)